TDATRGLVQEESRGRKAEPILNRDGDIDQRPGTCNPTGTDDPYSWLHEANHVVNRISRLDMPSLGVDKDADRLARVRCERKQLRRYAGGELLIHLARDDECPRLE